MKKAILLAGATSSGKTKLSIEIAKKYGFEVINCDSVQVYSDLNIGSMKISESEMEGVKHHLLSLVSSKEKYSVADFKIKFLEIEKNLETLFLVGGSGLYAKALLFSYDLKGTPHDINYSNVVKDKSSDILFEEILAIDPFNKVDSKNRIRLERMHERVVFRKEIVPKVKNTPNFDNLVIYLDVPRDILKERLEKRLEEQLKLGFIDEVKSLKDNGTSLNIIGYREIGLYLNNEISLDSSKERIIKSSMRLAKKQKTWFKNQFDCSIINVCENNFKIKVYNLIDTFLGIGESEGE
ncbi:MAG: tRNA (adenosine(37)-N6)-dimethylallyltransferase MiaA [Acholeplasmatales bacterium]|nr:tRNA (adenosine(37)-N6)-dimethylallyltransferase MiaA [Acholeplasmatales bacterium]